MRYVLYHSSCYDGFGAAYAAWKRFGEEATYLPVSYGKPVPEMPDASEIYIVDFSYPADALLELASTCKVVVLDHHKTAEAALSGVSGDNLTIVFNMKKSGALLAWEYFHPNTDVPPLVQHISDRDIWEFKLDGTNQVHSALVSYPFDFELWDKFNVEELKKEGRTCERLYNSLVEKIVASSWIAKRLIEGKEFPIVNTSIAWSEVGQALLDKYPDAPFVASFTVFEDHVMVSLRSEDHREDVSEIAKKRGGGGHRNAAGFKEKL